MNYLHSILLGLLLGCLLEFSPLVSFTHPAPVNPSRLTALKDSIKKLDFLVQNTMVTNPVQSIKYAQRAITYARELKSTEELIHGFKLMGQALYKTNYDSSFIYYNRALKLADSSKIYSLKPFLLYNCGRLYRIAKFTDKAMNFLDSSIQSAESQKDYATKAAALNDIGIIYIDNNNHDYGIKMFDSAYKIAMRQSLNKQIGLSLGNLARFEKDDVKAYKLNKEALRYLLKAKGTEEAVSRIYINIGYRATNPDSALFYYNVALKLTRNINLAGVEMGLYNAMANSYLEKGNIKSAEECLVDHAIPIAQKLKDDDWMATLYDSYADVLVRKGDYKAAAEWQKTALKKRKAADKAQASEQVRLLSVILDLKSKEVTIQDNQKQILVQQNRLQKTRLGLTITIFMIIGFVFIILWLQQRNRVRLQVEQIQSAKRIIEMEENEKAKVARELHDITGQLVLGITGEIENLDLPDSKIKDEIKGKIKDLGKSIRQISHRMNKAMLDNFTFEELIQGQCEDIQKVVGLKIRLEMPDEPIILNEEVVLHAYRIVQELLTNAGKYALDSYVSIVFQKSDTELIIQYNDNGPGFDSSLIEKKGMGLMNIFERAKLMNGSAKVMSSPGDGTSWEIKFPLVQGKIKTV
jgi:two-component system NarL family sensor kinase